MSHFFSARRRLAVALLSSLILAGCAADSGAAPPPATAPAPTATAEPVATATAAPTAAAEPTVSGPTREGASATVERFLEAYFAGRDASVYLADPILAEVRAGRPLHQFVGDQPGFQHFTVNPPDERPSEVLFVRADVAYAEATLETIFELAVAGGEWMIVGISAPDAPAASPWREGPGGDLNADGIPDQIVYRPLQIQLPPLGFSDPSIVALLVAEELTLRQEASPAGRELLTLGPGALSAEGLLLAQFDEAAPPAGFIVVVYGGDRHTFRVTPLRGDGQPFNDQAFEVLWDAEAGGYRTR
jgi:hypothetical protein